MLLGLTLAYNVVMPHGLTAGRRIAPLSARTASPLTSRVALCLSQRARRGTALHGHHQAVAWLWLTARPCAPRQPLRFVAAPHRRSSLFDIL